MTIRYKLADIISGGELSQRKAGWDRASAILTEVKLINDDLLAQVNAMTETQEQLRVAMKRIAACETPGANATVKRMARLAREALE